MVAYKVTIRRSALKELDRVGDTATRRRLVARIESLSKDPLPSGCRKLSGTKSTYRLRQGTYRIIYTVL